MQLVFLEVLQQRAAGAVHDALGHAGGTRGEHDEQRMVERQALERQLRRLERRHEVMHIDRTGDASEVRVAARVWNDHGMAHRRQERHHLRHARHHVDRLAAIEVAVGRDQHLRFYLAETVEYALRSEVGRAGRPGRAQAGGCQHRDDRTGDVRHVARDAVAHAHARCAQRLLQPGHLVVQLREGDRAAHLALATKDDRDGLVRAAQQVLGVVEPRFREPARAGHPVGVLEHDINAALGDHVAEIPDRAPELLGVLHRPAVQRSLVMAVNPPGARDLAHEPLEVRARDALGGGGPGGQGRVVHGMRIRRGNRAPPR